MKNTLLLTGIAIFAAVLLASCGGSTSVNVNTNRVANTASNAANTVANTVANAGNAVTNTASSLTTDSPSDFMEDAAQGGMAELEMGKLAAQKAADPEVKKFGQMMVTDHTAAGNELKKLAGDKKMTLPPDMGSHQKTIDKLKGLSGADFDKEYVEEMVSDHETDVAAFEKQANNGSDPEVKAFAAKTLPTLKKHLDAIKAIQAKMKK